jgi:hypothetical protein
MTPSPGPASTREARAALEYAIGAVSRANPIVAAWRWRYELAAAATLAAAWIALDTAAAAMDQPHFAKAGLGCGVDVLADHGRDVAWGKRVEVDLAFNRDTHRLIVHDHPPSVLRHRTPAPSLPAPCNRVQA